MEALRSRNRLVCSFAGISQPHINRRQLLPAKTGRFAQGGADDAAADVGSACVVLCKLVAGEITSGPRQVSIAKSLEVGADESSFLEFLCSRRNLFGHLRETLKQGGCLRAGLVRIICG